jgi:uncharacterized protein (TIGR02118 family)
LLLPDLEKQTERIEINANSLMEAKMTVKLVVLYPYPKDVAAFETAYMNEHVRLVAEKVPGVTQYVLSRTLGAPEGAPPFYLIAELYFPSVEALQAGFSPQVAQELGAHAVSISTGGTPISFICTEETTTH